MLPWNHNAPQGFFDVVISFIREGQIESQQENQLEDSSSGIFCLNTMDSYFYASNVLDMRYVSHWNKYDWELISLAAMVTSLNCDFSYLFLQPASWSSTRLITCGKLRIISALTSKMQAFYRLKYPLKCAFTSAHFGGGDFNNWRWFSHPLISCISC